eukprot:Partr_v1_DN28910_c0_g1_i2_m25422 putative wd repeat
MFATEPLRVLDASGGVNKVVITQSGDYCMSAGQDKQVRLWKVATGSLIKTYGGHSREIHGLAIAHDNSLMASCGADRGVFLWDVTASKPYRRLQGHFQRVNCVDFGRDSTAVLVSGSFDATVRLWDARVQGSETRTAIQVLDDAKDSVTSVQLDEYEIMASSIDGSVRRYDIRVGRVTCDSLGLPITDASYSKDRNCVLVSTLDDKLRLLDSESGEILSEYGGHQNSKYRIENTFSHTDAHVISGSEDGCIYVWDLVDESVVATLRKHSRAVLTLAQHPTEPILISGSTDGTVVIWGPPTQ